MFLIVNCFSQVLLDFLTMIPWEPRGCDYLATIWQHLHFHMAMFQPWLQKMTLYPSLADSGSQSGSCWRAGGNRVTRRQSGVVGRLQEPNAAPRRQRAGNNPGSNPPSSRQPFYGSLRTLHLSELSNCGIYVGLSSVQRLSIRFPVHCQKKFANKR